METNGNNTVIFKIGRGGRFYNGGYKTFEGYGDINNFTDDLFLKLDNNDEILEICEDYCNDNNIEYIEDDIQEIINNNINLLGTEEEFKTHLADSLEEYGITSDDIGTLCWYTDLQWGNNTGLNAFNDGTGQIEIDGEYNTIYSCKVSELDESELEIIINRYDGWDKKQILEEFARYVGFSYTAVKLMDYFNNWQDLIDVTFNSSLKFEDYEKVWYNNYNNEDDVEDDADFIEIDGVFYSELN